MNLERANLMGKPHIGDCYYPNKTTTKAKIEQGALCQICGRPASNAHHIVQKGIGGGSATMEHYGEKLRSPCITVCGNGNLSGCHELFHQYKLKITWEWYDPKDELAYGLGELRVPAHSSEWFNYGHYILTTPTGTRVISE